MIKARKRFTRIILVIIFLVAVGLEPTAAQTMEAAKPNIVFIMSDDHATTAVSAYGSKLLKTPNIDRIAAGGVLFENAFVTSSLCAPSRAAIMSGQYAAKSGFKRIGDVFDQSGNTLPKLLQKAGYATALFGKWHLKSKPEGFSHIEAVKNQGSFIDPVLFDAENWNDKGKGETVKGFFTDVITDRTIDWLKQQNSQQPFALFLHHKAPHCPHITPARYDSLFTEDLPYSPDFEDTFDDNCTFIRDGEAPYTKLINAYDFDVYNSLDQKHAPEGVERGTPEYKIWAYQALFKGYFRQIVNMDENIGRVLDFIEENNLEKNTIVVYTSDNGWFTGEHGLFNKMWMYEESIRIPLIIKYPAKVKRKRTENRMVSILDFAPTFLDYAGADVPDEMQGMSLKPLLENEESTDWRNSFFYHYYDQFGVPEQYGLRTEEYKLIHFQDTSKVEYELYDLKADPEERTNLIGKPGYRIIADSLMNELKVVKAKFED